MSNIVLQFGQCGNQLGAELMDRFLSDTADCNNEWFSESTNYGVVANCISCDSEKKVLTSVRQRMDAKLWKKPKNCDIIVGGSGSANNWSVGYMEYGERFYDRVVDCAQKLSEPFDSLRGFLSIYSLAGGTGSGVGSFVSERLKDDFPKKVNVCSVVFPHDLGEVVVQNYNVTFALSKFLGGVDSVFCFSNDFLMKVASQVTKRENIKIDHLNKILAGQMACLLGSGCGNRLASVVPKLTPDPYLKLVSTLAAPYDQDQSRHFEAPQLWNSIFRSLKRVSFDKTDSSPRSSLVNLVITRGGPENPEMKSALHKILNQNEQYPVWVPPSLRFMSYHSNRKFEDKEKFGVIASNNSSVTQLLFTSMTNAWKSYIHKAYVHHYFVNGMEPENFLSAFGILSQMISSYEELERRTG